MFLKFILLFVILSVNIKKCVIINNMYCSTQKEFNQHESFLKLFNLLSDFFSNVIKISKSNVKKNSKEEYGTFDMKKCNEEIFFEIFISEISNIFNSLNKDYTQEEIKFIKSEYDNIRQDYEKACIEQIKALAYRIYGLDLYAEDDTTKARLKFLSRKKMTTYKSNQAYRIIKNLEILYSFFFNIIYRNVYHLFRYSINDTQRLEITNCLDKLIKKFYDISGLIK